MNTWNSDSELFQMMKETLYTAVVGDIMDTLGYIHQFMPSNIRPLKDDMVLAGRAMTVLEADISNEHEKLGDPRLTAPFGIMFEALDDLKENEVYVCSGSSYNYAVAGELMATRAKALNAAGFAVNGFIRDTKGLLNMDIPVFSTGSYAQDQGVRGRVIAYRVPICMGNLTINPGDIIFGDIDGVLVIPQEIENEVITKAYDKVCGEHTVAEAIRNGMSTQEAFKTFGIM